MVGGMAKASVAYSRGTTTSLAPLFTAYESAAGYAESAEHFNAKVPLLILADQLQGIVGEALKEGRLSRLQADLSAMVEAHGGNPEMMAAIGFAIGTTQERLVTEQAMAEAGIKQLTEGLRTDEGGQYSMQPIYEGEGLFRRKVGETKVYYEPGDFESRLAELESRRDEASRGLAGLGGLLAGLPDNAMLQRTAAIAAVDGRTADAKYGATGPLASELTPAIRTLSEALGVPVFDFMSVAQEQSIRAEEAKIAATLRQDPTIATDALVLPANSLTNVGPQCPVNPSPNAPCL